MPLNLKDVRVKDIEVCGLACPYFEYAYGPRCNRRGGRRIPTGSIVTSVTETPEWCPLRDKPILLRLKAAR